MAGARTIDISSVIDRRGLGPFNYKLILLSWLITVFDGFDMMMISFTAPYMRDELGLSTIMLGNIFSAGLVGMMLGGFFFAYLGDRIGRRSTIIIAAFAFGLLTTATGFAQTYHQLMLLRFLDGFAIGGMLPLAWALNIEFVPTRMRSSVVTVIMVGYSVGTAGAGPLTVWIAPHHGWEGVFIAGGLGTLACATLLLIGLPESVRFLTSKGKKPELIAATLNRFDPTLGARPDDDFVLSDERKVRENFRPSQLFEGHLKWLTLLLWIGYIVSSLAVYFKASWGPIVLEELQFSRDTAAYVSSIGGVLGAVAGLVLMRFTDRKGPIAVAVYPLLAVPLLLFVGLVDLPPMAFLIISIIGVGLVGGAHFGMVSICGIFYPSAIRANGSGWATSVAKLGAIVGPLIGAAALASGIPVLRTYALLAICPAILAAAALGIHRVVRRRDVPQEVPCAEPVPAS
ncbi:MAG TPA: MFS transporter [Sphingomonadaceae bacterium]|jgi:AAHS family 4-hydroxybenzoate transporter-like MFS transporter|nr:MFS transporter [Sphingomonadaceae bacterium]